MKKLIVSTLVLSLLTVGGMTPFTTSAAQQAPKTNTAATADILLDTAAPTAITAETIAKQNQTFCPNGENQSLCPSRGTCINNGVCTYPDCPNGGIPALDGSGYHGGHNQGNGKIGGLHSQNGTGHGHGRNR